jgi:hypothetical protein
MTQARHVSATLLRVAGQGALALGCALALAGCGGYRLGPTNPELTQGKTIQVQFFENRTIEPRLPEALSQALRKQLQQDGSYRLGTQNDADVIVRGVIVDYERRPLSYQPTDVVTAKDYEIRLICQMTAVERSSGRVLIDRRVRGRTSLRAGTDLVSAERQALPLLAEDWARNATVLLTEGAW